MRRYTLIGLLASLAAVVTVGVAVAEASDPVQTISAGAITHVKVKTGTGPLTIGSQTTPVGGWVNIPGASASVTIATGQQADFIARLSAHTLCQYRYDCDVRFTVNGQLMQPDNGQFDGTANYDGADLFASANDTPSQQYIRTMVRAAGPYPAGAYTVRAQAFLYATGEPFGGVLTLTNWQFLVETAKA
jgi:hypothetical protein